MGRYSPTVIAQPGPSLADGLNQAAQSFIGMRDRKRQIARQQVADAQTAGRYNADIAQDAQTLANSKTQGEASQLNLSEARTHIAENAGLGGIEAQARARSLGFTGTPGAYTFDPSLAPLSPTQQFANQLTMLAKERGYAHSENVYTQGALNARDAANNAARLKEYSMMSDGRLFRYGAVMGPDGTPIPAAGPMGAGGGPSVLNGGTSPAQLISMSPQAKQKHFNDVASNAIRAADTQLPASDPSGNVSLNGQVLARADARRKLAAQIITQDPGTANYFSYGMNTDHLLAADQKFGERPAARAGKGRMSLDQAMAQLRGQAPLPTAGTPNGAGAPNTPNTPNAGPQKPVAQRDAELKAQGLKANERRAKLKAEGYNVQ